MTCAHERWESLPTPNEGILRCANPWCLALGYRKRRPSHRGAKPGRIRLYKCRERGCAAVVIERRYGTGWELKNGCRDHPVRPKKTK